MNLRYYLSALSAFVIWGTFSLVLKPLSDYPALEILLYRVMFATATLWLIGLLFRRKVTVGALQYLRSMQSRSRNKILANYITSALMLSLNWFLFIYVMNAISINATSLAYLLCPIVTTVLATIFLRERLTGGQWLAVSLSALSCILLSLGHFMDLFYSLLIAFSYAVYLILQKVNTKTDKLFALTTHITLSTLFLLPLFFITGSGVPKASLFYENVLIIAVVFTIIPLFLNAYALKGLRSSLVGILLYINPIISFFLAVFYFNEPITTLQIFAYGLIMLAVVMFNIIYLRINRKVSV